MFRHVLPVTNGFELTCWCSCSSSRYASIPGSHLSALTHTISFSTGLEAKGDSNANESDDKLAIE